MPVPTKLKIDRKSVPPYAPVVARKIKRTGKQGRDLIRDAILFECERRGWNHYRLAKLMEEHGVSPTSTYTFLSDPNGQLRSQTASRFIEALGLTIYPPK